jgi:phosphate uptake regulator/aminoglycoside phosphotransferase
MRILEGIEENFRFMVLEVSKQVSSALLVVERPDPDRIKHIESRDDYIDNLKSVIENACWGRIHGSHDNKRTLDLVRAANIVNSNLERIADYAVNVVSQVQYLTDPGFIRRYDYRAPFVDVDKALGLVFPALTRQDVRLALRICRAEFSLDDRFKAAFDAILADLRRGESPENAISCFNIFRYLERMGDALLNIGEAVIFAALGEKLKIHQYQALRDSLEQGGVELSLTAGEFSSIWGTRSGCRIGRVQEEQGPRSKGVLFKEGSADKLAREKGNIERWARLSPGLPPNIQAFQTDGDSASMLLEYLGGCNLQQVVLTAEQEIVENACFLVTQTVGGLWEQTLVHQPIATDFMPQMRSRLDDVFRLYPTFATGSKRLGDLDIPSLDELLAAAADAESGLAAPFSVLLHGDFNLNNIVYDHTAQRIHYIDLHRSHDGDYVQDTAVFLASNFRLPVFGIKSRRQLELVMRRFLEFARSFAAEQGDASFEARLTFGMARALATSARFEMNRVFAQELFLRGMYLLERAVAHAGSPWEQLTFPDAVLVY